MQMKKWTKYKKCSKNIFKQRNVWGWSRWVVRMICFSIPNSQVTNSCKLPNCQVIFSSEILEMEVILLLTMKSIDCPRSVIYLRFTISQMRRRPGREDWQGWRVSRSTPSHWAHSLLSYWGEVEVNVRIVFLVANSNSSNSCCSSVSHSLTQWDFVTSFSFCT